MNEVSLKDHVEGATLSPDELAEKMKGLFFEARAAFRRKKLFEDRLEQAKIDCLRAEAEHKEANGRWANAVSTCSGETLDEFDKRMGSPFGPIFSDSVRKV